MTVHIPRLIITAGRSGAGKTMVTCGILEALKRRGMDVTAYKCGPDYIDPMFHREVIGVPGYNLDTFLCGRENVRRMFVSRGESGTRYGTRPGRTCTQIAVIEGVMGYYDGLGGVSHEASTYDVADTLRAPAVLIVDARGASVSLIPYIEGFLRYRDVASPNSYIRGVILNRISPAIFARMKELIEKETKVRVYGYVPEMKEMALESRYLGLKLPGETEAVREKLGRFCDILEETVDIDGLTALAASAVPLEAGEGSLADEDGKIYAWDSQVLQDGRELDECGEDLAWEKKSSLGSGEYFAQKCLRIGVAMDEAFCFIYQDNLDILSGLGAELVPFSPLKDTELPGQLDGMILYGGYPELYGERLAGNLRMKEQIRQAVLAGLPCIAECGGFMYLTESIRDGKGVSYPMCGALPGVSFCTPSLRRFGYVTLSGGTVFGERAGDIPAHEFHYYDSEQCGESFAAKKPLSDRTWRCMVSTDSLFAGYPHIHYAGNPKVAQAFIGACRRWKLRRRPGSSAVRETCQTQPGLIFAE